MMVVGTSDREIALADIDSLISITDEPGVDVVPEGTFFDVGTSRIDPVLVLLSADARPSSFRFVSHNGSLLRVRCGRLTHAFRVGFNPTCYTAVPTARVSGR